jgi:hypothetical protein
MEEANDRRTEQRLRYRWPIRFAGKSKEKPSPGQMVDVSSKGMALLCHADENCPCLDQSITTNFSVPHFDSRDSFDTASFNRIGRVCRVDNLSSQVNRVAIQFAEPLFFKPGEQNISDSDAQQRLKAKVRSVVKAKEKTRAYGKALAKAKEKARNEARARAEAEAKVESEARGRAKAEERATIEAQARVNAEREAKFNARASARAYNEALAGAEETTRSCAEVRAEAEEKTRAYAEARAKAEAKAKTEARSRAKAEKKALVEAEKRAKAEAEAQEQAKSGADQIAKVKAEAAREIARIKAEAEGMDKEQEDAEDKAGRSSKEGLMDKVDKFITDRDRFF